MKISFLTLNICLILAVSIHQKVMAEGDGPECTNQFLKVQGAFPKTLVPSQTSTVALISSSGVKEAELNLSALKVNKTLVISGKMTNVGQCNISMLQPLKLHPIRNGLPLGWHSLPEGMASSRLQPGEYQSFSKEYPKSYFAGFNLSMGSWNLEASPKQEEVKKEEPAKPTEAKRSAPLSDAEKLFADAIENDDLTETNQRLNDSFARAQRENAANESFRNTMQQSIQTLQTLQMQQLLIEQQKQVEQQRALNKQKALESQKQQTQQGSYSSGQTNTRYQELPKSSTDLGPDSCVKMGLKPGCMK